MYSVFIQHAQHSFKMEIEVLSFLFTAHIFEWNGSSYFCSILYHHIAIVFLSSSIQYFVILAPVFVLKFSEWHYKKERKKAPTRRVICYEIEKLKRKLYLTPGVILVSNCKSRVHHQMSFLVLLRSLYKLTRGIFLQQREWFLVSLLNSVARKSRGFMSPVGRDRVMAWDTVTLSSRLSSAEMS